MPDMEMDEEQLVGAVTHMIGDKQVLIYMEQALNKVIASKEKVKSLEATAKQLSDQVAKVSAELVRIEKDQQYKLDQADKDIAAYKTRGLTAVDKDLADLKAAKEHELADYDGLKAQASAELAATKAAIVDAKETLALTQAQVANEQSALAKILEEKVVAETTLQTVNRQLAAIVANLPKH